MTRWARISAGLAGLAGLTVLALLASSGASGAAVRTDPRLTQAALLAKADAVCSKGYTDAEALRTSNDPTATGKAAARQVDAALVVLDEQVTAFSRLRGPKEIDRLLARTVAELRRAAAGLRDLRGAVVAERSTVDGAIRTHPTLVARINAASSKAADDLVRLGFLGCVAAQGDTGDSSPTGAQG